MAKQLTAPPRGFENIEYGRRVDAVQQKMQEQNMAGILLSTEHDIYYYTGFLTQFWQSPTRPWFVILPAQGKPIAIIPEIGVNAMNNGWMEDIRSWSSPHATDDGVSLLCATLIEIMSAGGSGNGHNIGINRGRETWLRMPLNDFSQVEQALKQHQRQFAFTDATQILHQQRMLKSPTEIAKLRYVAKCASSVFENLFDFVSIGMSDQDIFKAFKIECLKAGADDAAYVVGAIGRGGYDDIISPPAGKQLVDGDVLILDTGCTYDGYYCDFDRNYGFGNIDDLSKRAYETLWLATEAALDIAKPEIRCCDLFDVMHQIIQAHGAQGGSVGRYGHGLGLQLTEPPSHVDWDDTLLEAGMVLTLEPGMIYAPGKMMVHEENILITEWGVEMLSCRAPPQMPILS